MLIAVISGCGPATASAPTAGLPTTTPLPAEERPDPTTLATASVPTATAGVSAIWQPALATTWQWQLSKLPVDQSVDAQMYDIDLFENDANVVAELHAKGRKVVCYLSVGTWEKWRPDAQEFPQEVLGSTLKDWPDERWLDIRRLDLLQPIMEARLDLCKAKGFDGVEPDNVDAYLNKSGFDLTPEDQLAYNRWLAEAAHARGLSVGLKNDLPQVEALLPYFDWALNEQCFQTRECEKLLPFIRAGKAVFHVEYDLDTGEFCEQALEMQFNSMRKNDDLDAEREVCG